MITICNLLTVKARVARSARPEVVVHRNRPGFIERQDGSWINLPVQGRRQSKPKARRRLWFWLTGKE